MHKWLAACGVASRRAAEQMIRAGRVRVNGQPVLRVPCFCDPRADSIEVDGRIIRPPETRIYIAVHKPRGCTSTVRDPHAERCVVDLAPPHLAGRLKPVGRLDKDSEGLVVLTDDGPLIHRLTHPRYHIEKEYVVGVEGRVGADTCKALTGGVLLDDGPARALRAAVLGQDHRRSVVRIVLGEGRKRQIRRMFEALGFKVVSLRRVRMGPIRLGRLAAGNWRHLTKAEVRMLYRAVSLDEGDRFVQPS
ncbi:MAG: rRNA pseudouridine synthase [Candidatus Sumerlaeia bacterium]|nr:rRNA pseudouridine synthase [Candidatus Sumerlaeia bacterium]